MTVDDLPQLIAVLKARGYDFAAPTPATHDRVLARAPGRMGRTLTDILGWSLAFEPGSIDAEVEALLDAAGAIEPAGSGVRSRLRASTLDEDCYLHSAFPTDDRDAVFFGPDSYRFARLIREVLCRHPVAGGARIVDIGTGSGVGGIVAARHAPGASLTLTDVNAQALRLAAANAAGAGLSPALREGSILAGLSHAIDLALANPPYLLDSQGRTYRDGGDLHGAALSIDMAAAVLPRLAPGGRFILYTGSAIVAGADRLGARLHTLAQRAGCGLDYDVIDIDVFGEELARDAYREVDRIAIVSAVFTRPD
ncbi:MAG: methyltransferase [Sphingomonas sp.]